MSLFCDIYGIVLSIADATILPSPYKCTHKSMSYTNDYDFLEFEDGVFSRNSKKVKVLSCLFGDPMEAAKEFEEEFFSASPEKMLRFIAAYTWKREIKGAVLEKFGRDLDRAVRYSKDKNVNVLITEFERFGEALLDFIVKRMKNAPEKNFKFTLTSDDEKLCEFGKAFFRECEEVTVEKLDIYKGAGKKVLAYNAVLLAPAFDCTHRPRVFGEKFSLLDMGKLFSFHKLLSVNRNGARLLTAILPINFYYSPEESMKKARWDISKSRTLMEAAILPNGVIVRPEQDKVALISLGRASGAKKRFPVREYDWEGDKLIVLREAMKFQEDFLFETENTKGWNLSYAFMNASDLTGGVALKDIAFVFRGQQIYEEDILNDRNPYIEEAAKVVDPSTIDMPGIDYSRCARLKKNTRIHVYFLKVNDLLVCTSGDRVKTAVFDGEENTYIASSDIIVVRPKPGFFAYFLKIVLDSKNLTEIKEQYGLDIQKVRTLKIPAYNVESQKKLVEKYIAAMKFVTKMLLKFHQEWVNSQIDIYESLAN